MERYVDCRWGKPYYHQSNFVLADNLNLKLSCIERYREGLTPNYLLSHLYELTTSCF